MRLHYGYSYRKEEEGFQCLEEVDQMINELDNFRNCESFRVTDEAMKV
jgi:hypothetical protein